MLLFSLSLSLLTLINHHQQQQILLIISSFDFITKRNIQLLVNRILFIVRFVLILMFPTKEISFSSSSSTTTLPFHTSLTHINDRNNYLSSIISFNFNQNANDLDKDLEKKNKCLHRLIQSSTDLSATTTTTTKKFYSSLHRKTSSPRTHGASRIESALMTSDYSHLLLTHSRLEHISQSITDINMNRTIDLIKRNGAGDELLSSHFNDKQRETVFTTTDQNEYLTLEQVPIYNRRTIPFTSKQLLFISLSVFLVVICLSLTTTIFFLF